VGVVLAFDRLRLDTTGRLLLPICCQEWETASVLYDTDRRALIIAQTGKYNVMKLDSKRRIVIPAGLRQLFVGCDLLVWEEDDHFVVARDD
jgi:DNA-binding transcriptional regulator/RsmH inhibitor MraZ